MGSSRDALNRTIRSELAYQRKNIKGLASYMGFPAPSVSRRLSGQVDWRFRDLLKVSEYLGISFWDLMSRAETNAEINSKSTVKGGTK